MFLQLSVPDKVLIPERYVELEPEEVLSPEQEADKQRKVDRIKALIVKNRYLPHHDWTGLETRKWSVTKLNHTMLERFCRVSVDISFVFSPSMQNVLPSLALSPEDDTVEEVTLQEKEKLINISYELAAEASKRSKLVAGTWPRRRARHCCACCTDAANDFIVLLTLDMFLLFDHLPVNCWFLFLLFRACLCVIEHVALFHCSEKPVAITPSPSTVS